MSVRKYILALIFLTGCASQQPIKELAATVRDNTDLSEAEVLKLSAGAPATQLPQTGSNGERYSQTAALSHKKEELKNVPAPAPAASENKNRDQRVLVPVFYNPFFDIHPHMHYGSSHEFRVGIGVGTVLYRDL